MTEEPGGLRDRALVWLLALVIRLAEWLGVESTLRVGAFVGRAWYALGLPRKRRVLAQLAHAFPERTEAERRRLARAVFVHLGRGLAELLLLSGRHRRVLLDGLEVEGLEHVEHAIRDAGGRGVIMIGPHLGNWEIAAAKLADLGLPVAAVYRGLRQPALERAVVRVRAGSEPPPDAARAIQQIPMGRRAGVQFVRALEAGRSVLVLLDQHARAEEGLVVDFFGRPASTRFGPLKLADRAHAPVLLAFARREPDGRHHRLTIHPALQLEPGASDDVQVLRRNLQAVTAAIENEIRVSPEQWIWTHRRWRTPPEAIRPE